MSKNRIKTSLSWEQNWFFYQEKKCKVSKTLSFLKSKQAKKCGSNERKTKERGKGGERVKERKREREEIELKT